MVFVGALTGASARYLPSVDSVALTGVVIALISAYAMNSIHLDSSTPGQTTRSDTTESSTVSASQLARLSRISEADLEGLIDYGVLTAAVSTSAREGFASDCVAVLLRAGRLRSELALDSHAFALSVMLLTQIIDLETEVRELRGELSSILESRVVTDSSRPTHAQERGNC